jgi:hypothetical protein
VQFPRFLHNFKKSIYRLYSIFKGYLIYEEAFSERIFVGVVAIIFEQLTFATPALNISSASLILLPKKSLEVDAL